MNESNLNNQKQSTRQFEVKDCALIALATGRKALNLKELCDNMREVEPESVYHHFWGGLLQPRFEEREYNNDFAGWANNHLADPKLAEKLAALDPTEHSAIEDLRLSILDVLEQRMEDPDYYPGKIANREFEFVKTQIVVFDSLRKVADVQELKEVIESLSLGSIFYHFIDARRRSPLGHDDFSAWISESFDQDELVEGIRGLDPYFGSLADLRQQLGNLLQNISSRS